MRFTLPVLDACEVSELKKHGADELYCGVMDRAWREKYGGDASISRRQGAANLSSLRSLKELAEEAKQQQLPVHLTLNARVTGDQIPDLVQIAEDWAGMGGDGIIVQDPGLLLRLREIRPMTLTVSLLAVTVNRYGAAFWRDLGADRIVFPRFLRFAEMRRIAKAVPELCYEAMVMGDLCPFADGYCRSVHAESCVPAEPGKNSAGERETWHPSGCAYHLCREYGEPAEDPCAACMLAEMERCGVGIGKIGGRGLPLEIRLKWLDFLKGAGEGGSALPVRYREVFGHPCRCYYGRESTGGGAPA